MLVGCFDGPDLFGIQNNSEIPMEFGHRKLLTTS